jgi:hypothetical protein
MKGAGEVLSYNNWNKEVFTFESGYQNFKFKIALLEEL